MSAYCTDRAADDGARNRRRPRSMPSRARGHYEHRSLSDDPQHRRHDDGHHARRTASANRYGQSWDVPNLFVTGLEPLSTESRLQPDRDARRARLYEPPTPSRRTYRARDRDSRWCVLDSVVATQHWRSATARRRRWLLVLAAARAHLGSVLGVVSSSTRSGSSNRRLRRSALLSAADPRRAERRRYCGRGRMVAVIAGDCVSCHTRARRPPVRGRVAAAHAFRRHLLAQPHRRPRRLASARGRQTSSSERLRTGIGREMASTSIRRSPTTHFKIVRPSGCGRDARLAQDGAGAPLYASPRTACRFRSTSARA